MPPLPADWNDPPAEFSLAPFWFWNDDLREGEIVRQMDAFHTHGVDAFVLHPRVGLPRHLGWMSAALLAMMRFAVEQARARDMQVILYDEGMYPSGSASGQVVAENARYQCRGLVRIDLDAAAPNSVQQGVHIDSAGNVALAPDQTLVAVVPYQGRRFAIVDRPVDAVIRGLHFLDADADDSSIVDPPEDTPPAADLLNPDAVASFIRNAYDRYYQALGDHFGTTITAIFTDEPNLLGRLREPAGMIMPGTTGILPIVSAILGEDFTPRLPALWDDAAPPHIREDYARALDQRLEHTYYAQLARWCAEHGIALTGHPAEPDATSILRYFDIPGQDIVWRYIEPDKPSSLEGRQSTQAKAASSAMLHNGKRRNANEFGGAYGHNLTFDEFRWLAHWLLVRGCNLLIPHAFYYSVRGARLHERPPDVGLHSAWWDDGFTAFARACRRLCWLNTDGEHVCHVAILGEQHHLPYRAAKVCFEHQIDFNYLDVDDLRDASLLSGGIRVGDQVYRVLIIDGDLRADIHAIRLNLARKVLVIDWSDDQAASLKQLVAVAPFDVRIAPACAGLRVRHVRKAGRDWFILLNETSDPLAGELEVAASGIMHLLDPVTNEALPFDGRLALGGHELRVLVAGGQAVT